MRAALLLLLLANLVVGLWWMNHPREPEALPVAAPPAAGPRLELLGEVDAARLVLAPRPESIAPAPRETAPEPAPEITVIAPPPEAAPAGICTRIGPYAAARAAHQASQVFLDAGAKAVEVETESVVEETRYWVYLPPYKNTARAKRILAELQAKKIDSFLVTSGDKTNAISLGVFRSEDLAERLRQQIRAQGYTPRIDVRQRTRDQYWLDVREILPDDRFAEVLKRQRGVQREDRPCG